MPQAPLALLGIRICLGPLTAAALVIAILILSRYPIDEKAYAEILAKSKAMDEAAGTA